MQSSHLDYRNAVEDLFAQPGFITDLGVRFVDCGPGWCTTRLAVLPRHLQHTGVVHAGVAATMADHTAGGAAMTLLEQGDLPVTVEFKIHLLRAARGSHLECRGDVLKPGARFSITEASVFAIDGASRTLVAKLTATMAPVRG
ncbi:MAG: PaaI family thioesterase [Burkholderiaceae bacterium]